MHLAKLPTIFVKDGQERKAYHTVEAKELAADGWVEKGEKPAGKPAVEKAEAAKAPAVKAKEAAQPEKKEDEK